MTRDDVIQELSRAIEHAPASGPIAPGVVCQKKGDKFLTDQIVGWALDQDVFICSDCAGRIFARGCSLPGDRNRITAVWDVVPLGPCALDRFHR